MKARVLTLSLPQDRRIIAVSDIHGSLAYLRGLLEKLRFGEDDVLILVGDMIEKGPDNLGTLRYVMQLRERFTVFAVEGNCDGWLTKLTRISPERDAMLRHYISRGRGDWGMPTLAQMCDEIGFPRTEDMDIIEMRDALQSAFPAEFAFLSSLPTIIDTERYTFVHGGLPEGKLGELDAHACMKNDSFMTQGRVFDKWCIVGHWPVMLYGGDTTDATPIIDRASKIISIDGGCVLKDDGQLNALIIPRDGSDDFQLEHYDPFPVFRAQTAQRASERSAYIRWGDNIVRVLERGGEFSRCEHVRTGYTLDILTKYLYDFDGDVCRTNDCTDYELPVEPGDELSLVETTSRGYLCKRGGVSGWYAGQLI